MGEFDEATVRALHEARHKGAEGAEGAEGAGRAEVRLQVDDGTWEDLDLSLVFRALDTTASALGTLVLYGWLRGPATTAPELEAVVARLAMAQRLEATPAATAALTRALRPLPWLPRLLVETVWGAGQLPSLGALPRVLTVVAALAPLGFLVSVNAGLAAMAAAFVLNLAAHFWWNRRVSSATASVDFLAAALRAAWALGEEPSLGRHGERLKALSARLVVLGRAAREAATPPGIDDFAEYLRLYFLTRERRLSACAALVSRWRGELKALLELLGELDAAVAAGAFRRAQPQWCVPEWRDGEPLVLEGARHPLLGASAVPSTLELDGGLVVTGSNMSGKSTFLRAVGLNQLLAQSLGFSCALAHRGPLLEVATSLRATDGLTEGKSYYLAEAQRLGTILTRARPGLLVLVDEPFRGTNSTERVAASVAVLRHVRRAGALVVAATHDLEVTGLLDGAYQQGHFRDGLDATGLRFDYTLRAGVATEHNAIRLLSFLGYPAALVDEARSLVDEARCAKLRADGSGR